MKLLYFTFIFISVPLLAKEQVNQIEEKNSTFRQKVIDSHSIASKKLMLLTNWVDSFFGDKKSLEEQNQSRLRFYHILSRGEHGPISQSLGYNLQLKFPNLEKRLQINFEKESENEQNTTPTEENRIRSNTAPVDTDARGGLSLFLKQFYKFKLKLSAGIKVKIPPTIYSNFRISRDFIYANKISSNFVLETFWDKDRKFGQNASFDFARQITDNTFIRFANDFTWVDSSDTISASHGPIIYQKLSAKRAISYSARAGYANRPDYRVHSYSLSITYRQSLYKDWFYYDLSPFLNFNGGSNFRREPGASFKLEVSIGNF